MLWLQTRDPGFDSQPGAFFFSFNNKLLATRHLNSKIDYLILVVYATFLHKLNTLVTSTQLYCFYLQLSASVNCLLSHILVSDDDQKPTPEGSPESQSDAEDDCNSDEDENVSQLTTMEVERLTLPSNGGKGQGSGDESKAVVPKILWDTKVERAQAALAYIVKVGAVWLIVCSV